MKLEDGDIIEYKKKREVDLMREFVYSHNPKHMPIEPKKKTTTTTEEDKQEL